MTRTFALHHKTLESYFFEEIEQVQDRTGKNLPSEVEAYIVHLLALYARRPKAAGRACAPLGLEYLHARSESGSAKAHALRGVGDRALYISGVVPRSLDRTPVNVRYVRDIGEAAYREVADRSMGGRALSVLGTLAEMFEEVADVIGDVIDLGSKGENDLLSVYERWRTHGQSRDAKILIEAGVLIDTDGTDTIQ